MCRTPRLQSAATRESRGIMRGRGAISDVLAVCGGGGDVEPGSSRSVRLHRTARQQGRVLRVDDRYRQPALRALVFVLPAAEAGVDPILRIDDCAGARQPTPLRRVSNAHGRPCSAIGIIIGSVNFACVGQVSPPCRRRHLDGIRSQMSSTSLLRSVVRDVGCEHNTQSVCHIGGRWHECIRRRCTRTVATL